MTTTSRIVARIALPGSSEWGPASLGLSFYPRRVASSYARIRTTLVLGVLLASLWGCEAVGPSGPASFVVPRARELYSEAIALRTGGEPLRAAAKLEAAVALAPDYIEAHRVLQQLGIERLERGALQRRYLRFLQDAPGDAVRWYLLGRLFSDPVRQQQAFERALRLDPLLSRARAGLGFALQAQGEGEAARREWRTVLENAPGMRDSLLGLLGSLSGSGRHAEAREIGEVLRACHGTDPQALRAIVREELDGGRVRDALEDALRGLALPEIDNAAIRELGGLVLERGTAGDWARATTIVRRVRDRRRPEVQRLLGLLALRQGDLGRCYRLLATLASPVPDRQLRQALRFVRIARGSYTVALDAARRDLPDLVVRDRLAVRFDQARRAALRAEERPTAARLLELARRLTALGWTREAMVMLDRVRRDDGVGDAARALLEEIRHHEAFVASLQAYFREVYRRAAAGEEVPDLVETLDEIARMSRWHLGRDVVEPVVRTSFGPLGAFVDPRPSAGSGLARYFDRFNRFLVIGQRAGGPPEAVLFDRLAAGELPGPWSAGVELVVTENQRIKAYVQDRGGSIAAAALVDFVYLDLDAARLEASAGLAAWRRWGDDLERILRDPIEYATNTTERLSVREPLDLATRLQLAVVADHRRRGDSTESYIALVADAILEHEKTHLLDARRFLPLTDNLPAKLWMLLRHGFSPWHIEAWLEERAQERALATARDPRLVLAMAASFLPVGAGGLTPHAEGYAAMIRRLIGEAGGAIDRFPRLVRRKVILQQLRFMSPEELRWLGRRLID